MSEQETCVRPRPKRHYKRRGRLVVKLAAVIAERSTSAVYAVFNGRMKSKHISDAIEKAKLKLEQRAGGRS